MTPGEMIRSQRKKMGLTQVQLAKKIGVTSPTIVYWEQDKNSPKGQHLYLLCGLLDLAPADICGTHNKKENDVAWAVANAYMKSDKLIQDAIRRILDIPPTAPSPTQSTP